MVENHWGTTSKGRTRPGCGHGTLVMTFLRRRGPGWGVWSFNRQEEWFSQLGELRARRVPLGDHLEDSELGWTVQEPRETLPLVCHQVKFTQNIIHEEVMGDWKWERFWTCWFDGEMGKKHRERVLKVRQAQWSAVPRGRRAIQNGTKTEATRWLESLPK